MIEFDGLMAVKFSIGRKGLCARGDDGEFMRMPAVKETVWSTMQTENHLKRWTNLLWWFTFDALKLWATLYVPPSIFSHTQNNIFIFLHCDGNFSFFRCHKVNHSPHSHFIRISDTLRSAFNDNFVCCGNMTCRWGGKEPKSSSDKLESSPHLINSLWRCAATSTAIRHNSMPFTTQGRPIINQQ